MRKNNLAESVTFLVARVIGFLLSLNITYFKYNIYKAKSQNERVKISTGSVYFSGDVRMKPSCRSHAFGAAGQIVNP